MNKNIFLFSSVHDVYDTILGWTKFVLGEFINYGNRVYWVNCAYCGNCAYCEVCCSKFRWKFRLKINHEIIDVINHVFDLAIFLNMPIWKKAAIATVWPELWCPKGISKSWGVILENLEGASPSTHTTTNIFKLQKYYLNFSMLNQSISPGDTRKCTKYLCYEEKC